MHTDDLSLTTYNGIIEECEKFNHDLTLQFGILAMHCKNEDEYLYQSEILIKDWLADEDLDSIADDVFYGEDVDLALFKITLDKLLLNIAEIRKTPLDQREQYAW